MSGRAKRAAAQKKEVPEESKKSKGGLAVGDDLPEFELENDEGVTVASKELVADNGIVLFAYPKANTKGCTSQAVGLSEKIDELAAAGYKVYGISADKPKSQANWRKKESLKMNLLCDPSYEVLAKLGFTKGPKSINRSHIVVAKGGKLADVHYGITPKNSVKDAVTFCLANKGEALPAPAAEAKEDKEEEEEEAEAAGEEAAEAGEKAEQDKEADKEEAAAMETDEKEAGKEEDEDKEEDKAEEPKEEAASDKADEPAKEEAGEEDPAEEAAPAAEEAADKPAEEQAAAEAPAAAEPAAAEAPAAAAEEEKAAAEEEKPAAESGEPAAEKPAAEGEAAA